MATKTAPLCLEGPLVSRQQRDGVGVQPRPHRSRQCRSRTDTGFLQHFCLPPSLRNDKRVLAVLSRRWRRCVAVQQPLMLSCVTDSPICSIPSPSATPLNRRFAMSTRTTRKPVSERHERRRLNQRVEVSGLAKRSRALHPAARPSGVSPRAVATVAATVSAAPPRRGEWPSGRIRTKFVCGPRGQREWEVGSLHEESRHNTTLDLHHLMGVPR